MNLRERLKVRAIVNLIISVIERLVRIFDTVQKNYIPKKPEVTPNKPNRVRPLKKVVNKINEVIPFPWSKK
jgi:hypothetical protein